MHRGEIMVIKLESFKLITLEEFKNWEGFDKLVAQYGKNFMMIIFQII